MDESFLMGCYQLGYICSYIFSTVDARTIEKGRESDSYIKYPFHFPPA
jgi:hypothetical protein